MTRAISYVLLGFVAIAWVACDPTQPTEDHYDYVLQAGRVMDPESGLNAVRNVGIRDGRIEAISEDILNGDRVIDVAGLIVAPGFIDLHQHQMSLRQSEESYELKVRDGVTSALELEYGTLDVARWYGERKGGQIINYGVSVGHIPIRRAVMDASAPNGSDGSEIATPEQISEMELLIEKGLSEGAIAVGFGLVYTPAATTVEFESMLRIAADHGASAHIHLRGTSSLNPDPELKGLNEAIDGAAATGASLHVVHANSSGGPFVRAFLRRIEQARSNGQDVTTEAYPYEAGSTLIESALFDDWETWENDRFAMLEWAETGERLTRDNFAPYRAQGGIVIIHARTEEMTRTAIKHPLTMIASDGLIDEGRGHPRTSGTFSKVLGKYVRQEGVLTLMDALRKMTIEPAQRLEAYVMAMETKGRLNIGADADITIFDAATVIDRSTYTNPTLPPEGITYVLVNGRLVVEDGELLPNARPGREIRVL